MKHLVLCLVALGFVACSDNKCNDANSKLQSCGLEATTSCEVCELGCIENASCNDLQAYYGGTTSNAFGACVAAACPDQ